MRRNSKRTAPPARQKRKLSHSEAAGDGVAAAPRRTRRFLGDGGVPEVEVAAAPHRTRRSSDDEVVPEAEVADAPQRIQRSFWGRLSDNLSFMKYVIFILFLPPILNLSLLRQEAAVLFYTGQKVDMGWGQKMHIYCKGKGLPTVILDAPTGSNTDIWFFVQEELAGVTQVCSYDRSGIGNSDAPFADATMDKDFERNKRFATSPSTVNQMVNDLNHLVTKAKPLPPPFILVGSETGALIARMYAALHSEDVSDIVLIDPLVENLLSDNEDFSDYWYTKLLPSYEALHLSAAVGLSRIAFMLGLLHPTFFDKDDVSEDVLKRQKILLCNPWHINAAFYEYQNMNLSFRQMNDIMSMNSVPDSVSVSVIRREEPEEIPPDLLKAWKKSQDYLVNKLHPSARTFLTQERGFHKMYSRTSTIIQVVKRIITVWRNKFNGFPTYVE